MLWSWIKHSFKVIKSFNKSLKIKLFLPGTWFVQSYGRDTVSSAHRQGHSHHQEQIKDQLFLVLLVMFRSDSSTDTWCNSEVLLPSNACIDELEKRYPYDFIHVNKSACFSFLSFIDDTWGLTENETSWLSQHSVFEGHPWWLLEWHIGMNLKSI